GPCSAAGSADRPPLVPALPPAPPAGPGLARGPAQERVPLVPGPVRPPGRPERVPPVGPCSAAGSADRPPLGPALPPAPPAGPGLARGPAQERVPLVPGPVRPPGRPERVPPVGPCSAAGCADQPRLGPALRARAPAPPARAPGP